MAPIRNPSLEEFLTRARHAFGFLGAEFAFHEEPLTLDPDVNPYQVRYVNTTTLHQQTLTAKSELGDWQYSKAVA